MLFAVFFDCAMYVFVIFPYSLDVAATIEH